MTRLALIALAALLVAEPAAAAPRQKVMAVRVELARDAGTAAMKRRLNATARALCARTASPLFPGWEGRAWKCRRDAVEGALARYRATDV